MSFSSYGIISSFITSGNPVCTRLKLCANVILDNDLEGIDNEYIGLILSLRETKVLSETLEMEKAGDTG